MPDYEAMYFRLFRAVEKAVELLIEAQRVCEEEYISASEPKLTELYGEKRRD